MKRDDSATWRIEHILRVRQGGPDSFPNLIPICCECKKASGSKTFRSTFHYMYSTGMMTYEQALTLERQTLQECKTFDPRCEKIQKGGKRCQNPKGGKCEMHCWKHIRQELVAMDVGEEDELDVNMDMDMTVLI